MFCRACGQPVNDNQAICLSCGVNVGEGNKYCANCGSELNADAAVCLKCGVAVDGKSGGKSKGNPNWLPKGKDKVTTIILCLFLGALGVHNFYLGENKKGIIKIALCLAVGISVIFALIDLVKIVTDAYVVDPNKAF